MARCCDLEVRLEDHRPQSSSSSGEPLTGHVRSADNASIYYEVHGLDPGEGLCQLQQADERPRVVLIMGLACGCGAWRWQLSDLLSQGRHQQDSQPQKGQLHAQHPTAAEADSGRAPMLVCLMDNRGVGLSDAPRSKKAYSTTIMAQDVLCVMDHLRWDTAHVVGFSMGGMIATKLSVLAPARVQSMALISCTAGGWQTLPRSTRGLRALLRILLAKSPEEQADATLHFHFSRRSLREWVVQHRQRRQDLLRREYLTPNDSPPQPPHGFKGQAHACWHHKVTDEDVHTIRMAKFPMVVIHGRHDLLAAPRFGEELARRLHAPCILLDGAHFVVRECAGQINTLLTGAVLGGRHFHAVPSSPYMDPDPELAQRWMVLEQGIARALLSSQTPEALLPHAPQPLLG